MHRLKSRAVGIALGGTALSALAIGFAGAVSASAAPRSDGGYVPGWVYSRLPGLTRRAADVPA
jgi:hypothetical protein